MDRLLLAREDDYEPTVCEWVYFALDPGECRIKIGWTRDVQRRLRDLRRTCRGLELLGALRGGYNLERAMHGRFRAYRCSGTREWYSSVIAAEVLGLLGEGVA